MYTYTQLPPELAALEGRVHFVRQVSPNEWHMSCPQCGIDPSRHNESNPSDRFVVWLESRYNGKPFGVCVRHCGYKWSNDKADAEWTQEERALFAQKRKEAEEREEARIAEYARNVVMKQAAYKHYNQNLKTSPLGVQWLRARGFTNEWIGALGIGIIEDYKVAGRFSAYYSPAITMPVIALGGVIENVKVRVMDAKCTEDRYRSLYKTRTQHYHMPRKESAVGSKILLVEGEIKSDVVAMRGNIPADITIIGTQGKGVAHRVLRLAENADVVYLAFDPDAYYPDEKGNVTVAQVARKIGVERVRFIPVKQKPDDAILQGWNMLNALNMAIKPTQWKHFVTKG